MRPLLVIVCLLCASPALAQYWGHYVNDRFGYEVDVPPEFEGHGEASDGSAQAFYRIGAQQSLEVWGAPLSTPLEAVVQSLATDNATLGWAITAQSSTPQWAMLAGVRETRSFFQRFVLLCDGKSYAAIRLDFPTADLTSVEPVMQGLARSFVARGC